MNEENSLKNFNIPLERDLFLRNLIRELAGVLEDIVGYHETAGYISLVGQNIGEWINDIYKKEMGVSILSRTQVVNVLVDMKRRIQGEFIIASQDNEKIILKSKTCPFGDKVLDRPSMCMMTSNVFGFIAAENLGYAKIVLEKSIAKGDKECIVVVYLKPTPEAEAAEGREYFGTRKGNVD
jgi:predicted ArsR family transcriptional regulator